MGERFKLSHDTVKREIKRLKKKNPGVGEKDLEKMALMNLLGKFAKEKGYTLKDPKKLVIGGLIKRMEKSGEYYCPCRIPSGDKEKDEWIICPCTAAPKDIEKSGRCHCGLFWKE